MGNGQRSRGHRSQVVGSSLLWGLCGSVLSGGVIGAGSGMETNTGQRSPQRVAPHCVRLRILLDRPPISSPMVWRWCCWSRSGHSCRGRHGLRCPRARSGPWSLSCFRPLVSVCELVNKTRANCVMRCTYENELGVEYECEPVHKKRPPTSAEGL